MVQSATLHPPRDEVEVSLPPFAAPSPPCVRGFRCESAIDPPHRPANEADRNGSGTTARDRQREEGATDNGGEIREGQGRVREREQEAKAGRGKWHKYYLTVIDQFVSLPPLFPSGVIRHPGEGVQREEKTLGTCGVFGQQHFYEGPHV